MSVSRHPLATLVSTSLLALGLAADAWGGPWTELGDAGELPGSAQSIAGVGLLTSIDGTIATHNDRDLYCIRIVDRTQFLARVLCAAFADPDLWLFTQGGVGLSHNDACNGGDTRLTGSFVPSNGLYLLGISWDQGSALNVGGADIWSPPYVVGERAPDGPGAPGPLTSWAPQSLVFVNRAYSILLTGCEACDVPTPTPPRTWGLMKSLYR